MHCNRIAHMLPDYGVIDLEYKHEHYDATSDICQQVYDTLQNTLQDDHRIPWVTPVFIPGHPCFNAYRDMLIAYERLLQRLGAEDEDDDVEEIIRCLLLHGKLLLLEMFRCGYIYAGAEETPLL